MIKNLLNADEDPPPGTKVIIEDTVVGAPVENNEPAATEEASAPPAETRPSFEIPEDAQFFTTPTDAPAPQSAPLDEDAESLSALMADIENLDDGDLDLLEKRLDAAAAREPVPAPESSIPAEVITENPPVTQTAETVTNIENPTAAMPSTGTLFEQSAYTPPTTAETIRNMGLSWAAGAVLFGSVIFMMILGWFADLLLGSSPWGLVGGILLGGLIGIIQLFRISSQIYKK